MGRPCIPLPFVILILLTFIIPTSPPLNLHLFILFSLTSPLLNFQLRTFSSSFFLLSLLIFLFIHVSLPFFSSPFPLFTSPLFTFLLLTFPLLVFLSLLPFHPHISSPQFSFLASPFPSPHFSFSFPRGMKNPYRVQEGALKFIGTRGIRTRAPGVYDRG